MKQAIIYKYLGTNGVLETPIHLENIYSVKTYILEADPGQILTNGTKKCSKVRVPESELDQWTEIPVGQN